MGEKMKNKILEYFLKYVKIDTMSKEDETTVPSTSKQFNLAKILVEDLKELGLVDIRLTDNCFVYGRLPKNSDSNLKIGFIAHMDTIPGFSGTNVKPNVIYNYDGENIKLNNITLDTNTFSYLPSLKGKTLITTDGTTVLGADDKAGIANIMGMLWYYLNNPDVKHCEINVSFSPDEEIGGAMDQFDIKGFNSDFAYTVDGLRFNEIEYENFNAASAKVEIKGFDIHPGDAKDKMINASRVAMEFDSMLSEFDRPEHTEGYEGFNHLTDMSGEVGYAKLSYILRNHDKEKLESQKNDFINIKDFLNKKYGNIVTLTITDSYKNMKEKIMKDNRCVTRAIEAIKKLGFNPVSKPIRGGTDGARLTELGLNTPNLGTGGYNCHGPYEMACLEEMENVSKILIEISKTE